MKNKNNLFFKNKNTLTLILICLLFVLLLFLFKYFMSKNYIIEGNKNKQKCKFDNNKLESRGKLDSKKSIKQANKIAKGNKNKNNKITALSQ